MGTPDSGDLFGGHLSCEGADGKRSAVTKGGGESGVTRWAGVSSGKVGGR